MSGRTPRAGPPFPDPRGAERFYFTRASYDRDSGVAQLGYRFDEGPELLERITFPGAPWPADPVVQRAFRSALDLLHGIAGVSYYKAGLSPSLRLPAGYHRGMAGFLTGLYVHGLAEFGHVNALDVAARVHFVPTGDDETTTGTGERLDLPDRALVAMGGGKDVAFGGCRPDALLRRRPAADRRQRAGRGSATAAAGP